MLQEVLDAMVCFSMVWCSVVTVLMCFFPLSEVINIVGVFGGMSSQSRHRSSVAAGRAGADLTTQSIRQSIAAATADKT